MNNSIKITKYNNDTLSIQYNTFNIFKLNNSEEVNKRDDNVKSITKSITPKHNKNLEFPFMTTKQYKRTLRRKRKELEQLDVNPNNCIFLTLTTQESFT